MCDLTRNKQASLKTVGAEYRFASFWINRSIDVVSIGSHEWTPIIHQPIRLFALYTVLRVSKLPRMVGGRCRRIQEGHWLQASPKMPPSGRWLQTASEEVLLTVFPSSKFLNFSRRTKTNAQRSPVAWLMLYSQYWEDWLILISRQPRGSTMLTGICI